MFTICLLPLKASPQTVTHAHKQTNKQASKQTHTILHLPPNPFPQNEQKYEDVPVDRDMLQGMIKDNKINFGKLPALEHNGKMIEQR